ncbi:hypothetical protein PHYBLDRAFT_164004 [Phycomyces blakesleeanus NRRL 1555(-)]|uniref:Uncharacterized protein n=1 Tax=Phycomyces blakesleeanus (strain ATCC 8743b / DSM 1359 / FGSC 10004 / NBRC 33097 / NRRL 1555) TaxID=763407 RepID=A0A167Q1H2_PHYB8|nr:hypothetical protein PHYBLDRAFT_164004 [Phycomyces blakesleeanus NRRL 1555(-)]OAD78907.1 hypothetical protein PHYBLDRAFT_164004 [Phycomyces blakesleeanus NRRL 1555(-)]|eukprot:XP_018296947.1 hypothetical protein PHYBLDRAFT_164004 [Phycomyces blakesleeanus NRRL 1555(-)]
MFTARNIDSRYDLQIFKAPNFGIGCDMRILSLSKYGWLAFSATEDILKIRVEVEVKVVNKLSESLLHKEPFCIHKIHRGHHTGPLTSRENNRERKVGCLYYSTNRFGRLRGNGKNYKHTIGRT